MIEAMLNVCGGGGRQSEELQLDANRIALLLAYTMLRYLVTTRNRFKSLNVMVRPI
jgi:hypothetical protein